MMLRPSVVVFCMLAGLIHPLQAQQARKANAQTITIGTGKDHVVDLCTLAATLNADSAVNTRQSAATTVSGHKMVQLETLHTPRKQYREIEHDEPHVSYPNQEQIVWTCRHQNFQITCIQKIGEPDKPGSNGNPDAPEFPFNPKTPGPPVCLANTGTPGAPKFLFNPKKHPGLYTPKAAGTKLPSGPPVCQAVGQWYKYSFIIRGSIRKYPDGTQALVGGSLVDPHFIVTGGTDSETGRLPSPCPHPTPTPAKTPAKSKK